MTIDGKTILVKDLDSVPAAIIGDTVYIADTGVPEINVAIFDDVSTRTAKNRQNKKDRITTD